MQVYQEEDGQVELMLGIVIDQNDLDQILGHNPLSIKFGALSFNISFCEPPKEVSFDTDKKVYFVFLCRENLNFLKSGNFLVAIHMIDGVQFMLSISFRDNTQTLRGWLDRGNRSYMVLKGSTLE